MAQQQNMEIGQKYRVVSVGKHSSTKLRPGLVLTVTRAGSEVRLESECGAGLYAVDASDIHFDRTKAADFTQLELVKGNPWEYKVDYCRPVAFERVDALGGPGAFKFKTRSGVEVELVSRTDAPDNGAVTWQRPDKRRFTTQVNGYALPYPVGPHDDDVFVVVPPAPPATPVQPVVEQVQGSGSEPQGYVEGRLKDLKPAVGTEIEVLSEGWLATRPGCRGKRLKITHYDSDGDAWAYGPGTKWKRCIGSNRTIRVFSPASDGTVSALGLQKGDEFVVTDAAWFGPKNTTLVYVETDGDGDLWATCPGIAYPELYCVHPSRKGHKVTAAEPAKPEQWVNLYLTRSADGTLDVNRGSVWSTEAEARGSIGTTAGSNVQTLTVKLEV